MTAVLCNQELMNLLKVFALQIAALFNSSSVLSPI